MESDKDIKEDLQHSVFKALLKQVCEIGDDVIQIDKTQHALVADIGTDPGISDFHFLLVWQAIQHAANLGKASEEEVKDLRKNLESFVLSIKEFEAKLTTTIGLKIKLQEGIEILRRKSNDNSGSIGNIRTELHTFQDMFMAQVPLTMDKLIETYQVGARTTGFPCGAFLNNLKGVETTMKGFENSVMTSRMSNTNAASRAPVLGSFSDSWEALNETGIPVGQSNFNSNHGRAAIDLPSYSELCEDMNPMISKYKNLENRFKVNSVTIEGITFGSYDDVEDFIRENNPSVNANGFHDVITLLEQITSSFTKRSDNLDEKSKARKAGF